MPMLESGLAQLGIKASVSQLDMINAYIDELEIWNARLNLVKAADREEIVIRHIFDCLAALRYIRELPGGNIADIGSGAGLPGLVLSFFLDDMEFFLVERSGKKAGFLRSTVALLGLRDRVEVIESDLSDVAGCFDIVTLRAFREFGAFYRQLRKIVPEGGRIAAYKGRLDNLLEDLRSAGLEKDSVGIIKLDVPFLEAERHLLLI